MNIVLALHQFFPHFSAGTEQLSLWVARWLRAAGHQVSIACGAPPTGMHTGHARTSPYVFEGFDVTPFDTSLRHSVRQSPVEAEYNNLAVKAQFSDYLRQKKPDLVHFFHLGPAIRIDCRRGSGLRDSCVIYGYRLLVRMPHLPTPASRWQHVRRSGAR